MDGERIQSGVKAIADYEEKRGKKTDKGGICNIARGYGFSMIKVFILSHQTCFDLYEILRGCSIN